MEVLLNSYLLWGGYFVLIFLRLIPMFAITPIFGRKNIPVFTRIALTIILSYLVLFTVDMSAGPLFGTLMNFTLLCLKELMLGLIVGFATVMLFATVIVSAHLIDMQLGFSMAQMFDPQMGTQVPLTGTLLNTIFLISFLCQDGHLRLINLLASSFKLLPPGSGILSENLFLLLAENFSVLFLIGIQISMPIMIAALLTEMALGIVIRTVPQMNMFVVGIPVKILTGLFVLMMMMPTFIIMTKDLFEKLYTLINNIIVA